MTLLLLGGTSDARYLANALHQNQVPLIYSIAGKVRKLEADFEVVSGGFEQYGGLQSFIRERNISAILDVTHPYAETITRHVFNFTQTHFIPYWRYQRPVWQAETDDQWIDLSNWSEMFPYFHSKKRILFTQGHLSDEVFEQLLEIRKPEQQFFLRTMIEPKQTLPDWMTWVKAGFRFSLNQELDFIRSHHIDLLISKNSGGDLTYPKLESARLLNVPVLMLKRPLLPTAMTVFDNYAACLAQVTHFYSKTRSHSDVF